MQQNATPARSRSARLEALCCRGTWTCPGCPHVPSAPFLLWAGPYPWGCVLGRTGVWICTSMRVPTSGKLPEKSGSAKSNTPLAKGYNLFLAENNNNQNPYILLLFGFLQLSDLRNCSPVVFLRDTQVFSNTCFYVRKLQEIKIVGKFYPSWPLAVWFSDNTPALSRSGDFFPQQWAVGA